MRICCASDLHGHLPAIPDVDLLLLAGDYCPPTREGHEHWWYRDTFRPWVDAAAERMPVVGVAGNHETFWEKSPHLIPAMNWTYLLDSGVTVGGVSIFGIPWQPRFFDWAFNLDEPDLAKKWAAVPVGTDILLTHGPPYGYGDRTGSRRHGRAGYERLGSPSQTEWIVRAQPKFVVCGHIHGGYGSYRVGPTIVLNVAHCDEDYRPVNPPVVVDI